MPNNLGELIERQRIKLGIQQQQVARMLGITNVSLCKVQTGERNLGKKRLRVLSDVLQVPFTKVLECAGYNIEEELGLAIDKLSQANKDIVILLSKIMDNKEDISVLHEIIAILNKSNKDEKENLKQMLKLLKHGMYSSSDCK